MHRFQLFVSKIASFDFQSILNHWTKVLQDMFWVFTVEFSMEDYSVKRFIHKSLHHLYIQVRWASGQCSPPCTEKEPPL